MYMAELSQISFLQTTYDETIKQGWGNSISSTALFEGVAELLQSRTKLFAQVEDWKYFFFDDSSLFSEDVEQVLDVSSPTYSYDMKALKKAIKKDEIKKGLSQFCKSLKEIRHFDLETIINLIRDAELAVGLQEGKLNQGLRISLTGKTSGAGLHEIIKILGKERVELRLGKVLEALSKL
jgi:glutamyl/glutaminyl-tRNA synthetase